MSDAELAKRLSPVNESSGSGDVSGITSPASSSNRGSRAESEQGIPEGNAISPQANEQSKLLTPVLSNDSLSSKSVRKQCVPFYFGAITALLFRLPFTIQDHFHQPNKLKKTMYYLQH